MTPNNRLWSSAPEVEHAPPRDPDRPLGCQPDPGSPPEPPKPGPDWCADPILVKSRVFFNPAYAPYWRGCGKCAACHERRRMRQLMRGRR